MKYFKYYSYTIALLGGLFLFTSYFSSADPAEPSSEAVLPDNHDLPQVIKSIALKESYSFGEESIDLGNFDVKERLERELLVNSYWHSSTVLNIKNANRYFPVMEKILAEEEVPDDFKYLAVIESNLRNATSPAGAKGVWQFMSSVGKYYGLEINSEVDERFHLEKATHAACKYIKESKRKFGTWTNAAAAYNMGGTRFKKEMSLQKMDSYYDMNLNQETGRYLFRILAVKEIISDPSAFGFHLSSEDMYAPIENTRQVEVSKGIPNLGEFAKEHGTTYRLLKWYNPWLRTHKLTNSSGKTYHITLPS